jgi:hypothetical protein
MTPPTTPTPGAKRAAEAIFGPVGLDPRLNDDDYADVAAIIDRETGARELLEALETAVHQFDFTVKALALGHTVSISSLQNCAAAARAAIRKATEATP